MPAADGRRTKGNHSAVYVANERRQAGGRVMCICKKMKYEDKHVYIKDEAICEIRYDDCKDDKSKIIFVVETMCTSSL